MARFPFGLGIAGGDGDCSHVSVVTHTNKYRSEYFGLFKCSHGTGLRV
jgi:hypothetical protein